MSTNVSNHLNCFNPREPGYVKGPKKQDPPELSMLSQRLGGFTNNNLTFLYSIVKIFNFIPIKSKLYHKSLFLQSIFYCFFSIVFARLYQCDFLKLGFLLFHKIVYLPNRESLTHLTHLLVAQGYGILGFCCF